MTNVMERGEYDQSRRQYLACNRKSLIDYLTALTKIIFL